MLIALSLVGRFVGASGMPQSGATTAVSAEESGALGATAQAVREGVLMLLYDQYDNDASPFTYRPGAEPSVLPPTV